MSGTRGVEVPLEHVMAELAAFPLTSEAASRHALIQFERTLRKGGEATSTGRLWREAEAAMVNSFPSFGIDELAILRDWLWFRRTPGATLDPGHEEKPVSLVEYLRSVAHATLRFSGNVFRPKMPPWTQERTSAEGGSADARARHFWRWVSFALPADLLMAAYGDDGGQAAEVEVVSPILARILADRGYVEPHMHMTAALDFPLLWISTLHAVADPAVVNAGSFRSPGAESEEGRLLGEWLVRAATTRYVLAAFLRWRLTNGLEGGFNAFVRGRVNGRLQVRPERPEETSDPRTPPRLRVGAAADPGASTLLRVCLRETVSGRLEGLPFRSFQHLYAELTQVRRRWVKFPDSLEGAYQADPIQGLFPARGNGRRSAEMEWVAASLNYLAGPGQHDEDYAYLFWQVVRIRNRFYRHVVQRPMTPGLQWFVRFFSRMRPGRNPISRRLLVRSATEVCGMGKGLRSLELRTAPEPNMDDMHALVDQVREAVWAIDRRSVGLDKSAIEGHRDVDPSHASAAVRDRYPANPTEVGLVLHFSRDRGGGAVQGLPEPHGSRSHADPEWPENMGYRFARYYRAKRAEALALAQLIQRFPRTLRIIRGLDLCTDETGIPTWVMAPLCRYVRDVSNVASAYLRAVWKEEIAPLRMTVHAGEDFVHLLGGLRRIDEAVDQLGLGQGDRIGHGMALGTSAEAWARRSSGVAITRMERLLDLAWEWAFCTQRAVNLSASRVQYVINQIEDLSTKIFARFAHPLQVVGFAKALTSERELATLGFPNGPLPASEEEYRERRSGLFRVPSVRVDAASTPDRKQNSESWQLLYAYFSDRSTFRRGQEPILIDPSFEVDTIDLLQQELRRKIGQTGITVEINPSSNLLIGNLTDLKNHPLWRLKPPRGGDGSLPVAVCVGSDNPLTFTTRTREEYQLIYDTLTLAGLTDAEALRWVEEARNFGLESRFTLSEPRDWSPESIWSGMDLELKGVAPLL